MKNWQLNALCFLGFAVFCGGLTTLVAIQPSPEPAAEEPTIQSQPRKPYTYVVEVEGHMYLVLRAYAGFHAYGGMVHHPECLCKGA